MVNQLQFYRVLLCVVNAPVDGIFEVRCRSYGEEVLRLPVKDVPEALHARLTPETYLLAEVTLNALADQVQVKRYELAPQVTEHVI